MINSESIWIAWEKQPRSVNLAALLKVNIRIINFEGFGAYRHLLSILTTFGILLQYRKKVVFVQNPSLVLAFQACLLKYLLGYTLVVDRHSNFKLGQTNKSAFSYKLFHFISNCTLRWADITIVTNREIAQRVLKVKGKPVILPDVLPDLSKYRSPQDITIKQSPFSILFPCSWAKDEPLNEVAELCKQDKNLKIYVTGKPKANFQHKLVDIPDNFIKTGFMPEQEYFQLMAKCHAVMPLTKYQELLVCGGYEGVSLEKPLILSDTIALREYFNKGAVFTDCTSAGIGKAVAYLQNNYEIYCKSIQLLRAEIQKKWPEQLDELLKNIASKRH